MHKINVEKSAFEHFDRRAREIRNRRKRHDLLGVNVMGAIGSGKTAVLSACVHEYSRNGSTGVIAGDVSGNEDARRYRSHDLPAVNVSTGSECHIRPQQVLDALDDLPLEDLDLIVVENVGNLVCPADVPLGMDRRIAMISITEGDDMIRKHPDLFTKTNPVVLNKIDLQDAVDADPDRVQSDLREIHPHATLIKTSAVTGKGLDQLAGSLFSEPAPSEEE